MAYTLDPGKYDPLPARPRQEHAVQAHNPVPVRRFRSLASSYIVSLPILQIPIRLPPHQSLRSPLVTVTHALSPPLPPVPVLVPVPVPVLHLSHKPFVTPPVRRRESTAA